MFMPLKAAAVSNTCSRVSALQGPATTKGLADLKKDICKGRVNVGKMVNVMECGECDG
jgi:hypothetical protein